MNAEYIVINHNAQGEEIEHVGKMTPNIRTPVLSRTLCIKPVALRNPPALMITPNQVNPRGPSKLQAHQQRDGLYGE